MLFCNKLEFYIIFIIYVYIQIHYMKTNVLHVHIYIWDLILKLCSLSFHLSTKLYYTSISSILFYWHFIFHLSIFLKFCIFLLVLFVPLYAVLLYNVLKESWIKLSLPRHLPFFFSFSLGKKSLELHQFFYVLKISWISINFMLIV